MDYEYDDYEPYEPEGRVLWGRLGVYAGSLVLAFVLGACIFGGGVSQSEYEQSQALVQELSSQNTTLEQEIALLEREGRPTVDEDENGNGEDGEDGPADDADDVQIHEVADGDSLSSIAQQYYDDSTLWEPIAEENDLETGNLTIGEELVIPPLSEVQADDEDLDDEDLEDETQDEEDEDTTD